LPPPNLPAWRYVLQTLAAVVLAASAVGAARPTAPRAPATPFIVTKTDDTADGACDADCSLREAVIAANAAPGADTITVPAGVYVLTIPGTGENLAATGDLDIRDDLVLTGVGADVTVVDAAQLDRAFHVHAGVSATWVGLQIRHGLPPHTSLSDSAQGGGIYSAGSVTIANSLLTGNEAVEGGGLFALNGQRVVVQDSQVVSNTAVAGGGLYVLADELSVAGSTIAYNQYEEEGGGLLSSAAATIVNTTVAHNYTTDPGFSFGGGLMLGGDNPGLVEASQIYSNTAWAGAGIIVLNGQVVVSATAVTSNTASGFGGGLFFVPQRPSGPAGDSLTLDNVTLSANTAITAGAGIFNQGQLSIVSSDLLNNTAGEAGGALLNGVYDLFTGMTGTAQISGSLVSGNIAGIQGGGLNNSYDSLLTVLDSKIMTNTASMHGGGVANQGTLVLQDTQVSHNQASQNGGGIANGYLMTITRAIISDNTAALYAGGIFAGGPWTDVIQDSTIASNTAPRGAGLYADYDGVDVTGTAIVSNTASVDGGGVYASANITLTNSTVSGNAAHGSGAGFFQSGCCNLAGPSSRLNNVTVAHNTADADGDGTGDAGGLQVNGGVLTTTNSIIAGNRDLGGQAPDCTGTLTSAGYNLIGSTAGCTLSGTLLGDMVNMPAGLGVLGDYGGATWTMPLLPGSPARDAGNPAAPGGSDTACALVDQRGLARPDGPRCDLGAVERHEPVYLQYMPVNTNHPPNRSGPGHPQIPGPQD
jgi:CSLREA domain-containing protein